MLNSISNLRDVRARGLGAGKSPEDGARTHEVGISQIIGLTNQGFNFDLFQGAPTIRAAASKKPTDARSFPPWHEVDCFADDFYYVSNSIMIGHS